MIIYLYIYLSIYKFINILKTKSSDKAVKSNSEIFSQWLEDSIRGNAMTRTLNVDRWTRILKLEVHLYTCLLANTIAGTSKTCFINFIEISKPHHPTNSKKYFQTTRLVITITRCFYQLVTQASNCGRISVLGATVTVGVRSTSTTINMSNSIKIYTQAQRTLPLA